MSSRTSSATKCMKLTTCAGSPLNLARSCGSCVATPTGQVFKWQTRIMMQPSPTSGAVAKPNSSAPSNAATTTSRPVLSWPSVSIAMLIAIVAAVGLFLAPPSVPAVAFACFLVLGVGLGLVNTLMWAFEADTVEYGEWTSGVRTEGITYAAFSFTRKMGQAVGGAAAAFTLGFGGYVAGGHVHQTSSALLSIWIAAGVVPAAF